MGIRKRTSKDGSVSYYVYVTGANGATEYVGRRAKKADAVKLELAERTQRQKVKEGRLAYDPRGRTVAEAFDDVLPALPERSRTNYQRTFGMVFRGSIGPIKLSKLRRIDIEDARDAAVKKYAPASVRAGLVALSSAMRQCVERGWISDTPCRRIKYPRDSAAEKYSYIRTKDEIANMLREARWPFRAFLAFAVFTGCRPMEVAYVQWEDVDIDRRLICIQRGQHGPTKSGRMRWVPILDPLLPVLRQWKIESKPCKGLVFPGQTGEARHRQNMLATYRDVLGRAGLDKKLRLHDLRHTFASHWMMNGGDIFRLSKILGHANIKDTLIYAHLAPDAYSSDYDRISVPPFMDEAQVIKMRG